MVERYSKNDFIPSQREGTPLPAVCNRESAIQSIAMFNISVDSVCLGITANTFSFATVSCLLVDCVVQWKLSNCEHCYEL